MPFDRHGLETRLESIIGPLLQGVEEWTPLLLAARMLHVHGGSWACRVSGGLGCQDNVAVAFDLVRVADALLRSGTKSRSSMTIDERISYERRAADLVVYTLLAAAASSVMLFFTAAVSSIQVLTVFVLLLGTALQVALVGACCGGRLLSAGTVPIIIVDLVGIFGYFFYPRFQANAAVSAVLPTYPSVYQASAHIFAVASAGLSCGAAAAGLISTKMRSRHESVTQGASLSSVLLRSKTGTLNLVAALTVVLAVAALSPKGVFYRDHYGDAPGVGSLNRVSALALCIGLLAASISACKSAARGVSRAFGTITAIFIIALLVSKDTRLVSAVPSIVAAGSLSARARHTLARRITLVITWIITSYIFIALPINLRAIPHAGVLPYFAAIADKPSILVHFSGPQIFGNLLFSVPLAGVVALSGASLSRGTFLTSVDPRPSGLTTWAQLAPQLRINGNTPYNALGELGIYGSACLFLVMTMSSAIFVTVESARRYHAHEQLNLANRIIALATSSLFALNMLQYNMRSTIRYVWYAAGWALLVAPLILAILSATRRTIDGEDVSRLQKRQSGRSWPGARES